MNWRRELMPSLVNTLPRCHSTRAGAQEQFRHRRPDHRRGAPSVRPDRPLVNYAGAFISKPFTDYTAEDYALIVGVNLTGFFWLTQRAVAEMATRYGGHVVNVAATLAEVTNSGTPAVLAALTKGGLAAATRSLAIEYASRGIRVNTVSRASSRPRCTRWKAMTTSAAGFPRSDGPAR